MKQAVILAAGEGHRLKPLTENKPKAMISIAGKPIIQYVLESLAANGIREIIIIVGFQKEKFFDYLGDGKNFGVSIRYINQNHQIGSGNALAQAKGFTDDEFIVLSANKLISPETIASIANTHAPAVMIKEVKDPARYGVVTLKDGKVIDIVENPTDHISNMINAGIYVFDNTIFEYIENTLGIPEALNTMVFDGKFITAVESKKTWLDVVYPWDILSLNSTILQNIQASQNGLIEPGVILKGLVSIGKGTIIRSNSYIIGPAIIGKGCDIGPNICIFPATSIADNVVISPFTTIKNCVIGNDVSIASNCTIEDSVIDEGCIIGPHLSAFSDETEIKIDEVYHKVKTGIVMGRGTRIGSSVTAEPGTILGNYTQIKSLKLVKGNIPDKSLVV
jgi:UDP-N-acetylglucosamine diphosphorylase/glucosamine-1-phosphate N-acetyltransferase